MEKLKLTYTNTASLFIPVNGMEVHYRDEGKQTDTIPIVLIHGTGSSLHTFDVWADSLKKSNCVIRMDLSAYGLTGPFPDANYSMRHYTSFMTDFLTALGIKKCVLVGNCSGGQIACNFTLEEPNMVEKLILIDTAGYPKNSKSEPIAFTLAKVPVLNKLLIHVTPRFLVRAGVENIYFDTSKVTDVLVDKCFDLTLREGNRQAFVDRLTSAVDSVAFKQIKNIQQPTLILWGANDMLIPLENGHRFKKELPNNSMVILDDTGHTPMEERPFESLKPIVDFLKNTEEYVCANFQKINQLRTSR